MPNFKVSKLFLVFFLAEIIAIPLVVGVLTLWVWFEAGNFKFEFFFCVGMDRNIEDKINSLFILKVILFQLDLS